MAQAGRATDFTDADLQRMREPVLKGITQPERWRREQLQRLRNLVSEHESAILQALHQDLAKPPLEAMAEAVREMKTVAMGLLTGADAEEAGAELPQPIA